MSTRNGSDYDQATVLTADDDKSSDTSSQTGDSEVGSSKANNNNRAPKGIVLVDSTDGHRVHPKKYALIALVLTVLCLVALVTVGVFVGAGCNKSDGTNAIVSSPQDEKDTSPTGTLQDDATVTDEGDEEDFPGSEVTEEDHEGQEGDVDEDDLDDEGIEEPVDVEWETSGGSLGPSLPLVPLLSLGNFTGMGSSIVVSMLDYPGLIFLGDPDSGCVTAMKQTGGWELAQMWLWGPNAGDTSPPGLNWEQVGDPICQEGTFGTQVGLSTDRVQIDWGTIFNPQNWDEIDDAIWGNNRVSFVASNPTSGTLSFYSYDSLDEAWVLKQTIESPEGYELQSFRSEEDYVAVSYVAETAAAVARSSSRSPTGTRIDIYRYDSGSYGLVSEGNSTFVGVHVDTDDEGHVVTLGADRSIRAYHKRTRRFGRTNYIQVGPVFKPALVLNDASVTEDDLTIVKCNDVDVVVTAAVADTGANGNKTIGIGTYTYRDPDGVFPCLGTPYFPNQCDDLPTDVWDPSYHGAVEFEPNPTEEKPVINFNPKGSAAAVATKDGFKVILPFDVSLPLDFDLGFDPSTYESHELVDIASWGVVSVLVNSIDGTQEIQTYMMAGC